MPCNLRMLYLLSLTAVLPAGCASVWPPKPAVEDVAVDQQQRKEEMIASFDVKRDEAQFQAAMVRWRERDADGCRELVERLLARSPQHRGGRLLRAEFRLVEERPELAIADIEKLVAEQPADAEAAHMLGLLLEASGRGPESLIHFERASELAPENEVFQTSYHTALVGENNPVHVSDTVRRDAPLRR